ncbi:MAG: septum formation initiator family protein [Candidatus Omnitrophica bacterium]|nr:septum formation initiator family protein [Candidatus Omnitrophota bacterium]
MVLAGIFGLVFLLAVFYIPVLTRYRNLKLQEEAIDVKINDLDQKIKRLVDERDLLKNDRDYLEKVIRKELGLVKPGEIVYKFITESRKKEKEAPKMNILVAEEAVSGVPGTQPPASPPIHAAPESGSRGVALNVPSPQIKIIENKIEKHISKKPLLGKKRDRS